MYTVTYYYRGKDRNVKFDYEWQAAQYAEMLLDKDAVLRGPDGKIIPLYADTGDGEL